MKKIFGFLLVAIIATFTLSSCSQPNYSSEKYYISYGDVIDETHVLLDDSSIIEIVENEASSSFFKTGKRLIMNFNILEDLSDDETAEIDYKVRINAVNEILKKAVVNEADLSDEEIEELGEDKIEVTEMWLSQGKYLNVAFTILTNKEKHLISGVLTSKDENEITIGLRHNAFEDKQTYASKGVISLLISDVLDGTNGDVTINLEWTNYDGNVEKDYAVLKRAELSSLSSTISPSVQNLNSYMIY